MLRRDPTGLKAYESLQVHTSFGGGWGGEESTIKISEIRNLKKSYFRYSDVKVILVLRETMEK